MTIAKSGLTPTAYTSFVKGVAAIRKIDYWTPNNTNADWQKPVYNTAGGDGASYDIGYGGLDHVISTGEKMVRYTEEQILDLILEEYDNKKTFILSP
ncbi:hypothetical protein D0T50_13685, partial [Bacteroides sp. 214]|nr:hypothetical protein [Bacteroides sp. 214]